MRIWAGFCWWKLTIVTAACSSKNSRNAWTEWRQKLNYNTHDKKLWYRGSEILDRNIFRISSHFVRKITYDNKFMYYKFWFFNIKVFLEQWKDRDFPFFTLLYSTTLYFNTLHAFLPKTHYPHWYILLWSINMIMCTWLSYFYLSFLCSVLKFSMLCTWFFCLSRRTFDIFPYGIPSWTTSASVQSGGRLLMWTTREGPLGEFCSSFTCNNKESCYETIYQIQSPSPTKPKS